MKTFAEQSYPESDLFLHSPSLEIGRCMTMPQAVLNQVSNRVMGIGIGRKAHRPMVMGLPEASILSKERKADFELLEM